MEVKNRRASFDYKLLSTYQAGMVLTGTEVKSIREGKANLSDSYCYFYKGELYVKNMHVSVYKFGTYNNHEPRRMRKLLLNAQELKKLEAKTKERGFSIVPTKLYISDRGFVKMEIALATGKKSYDKRESIKGKDMKRDMERTGKMA